MRNVGSIPRSDPLAFFLTWTAYGSWLPGDDRGWVDGHGEVHGPEPQQQVLALRRMAEEAVVFDPLQRVAVEEAITAHCRVRGWHLHAVECRSQHVHVVVTAVDRAADDVMKQFKSWATRALKVITGARGLPSRTRWWTEGGSRRQIFCEGDLASVVSYVRECQGVPTQQAPPAGQ
jgi:REP element-mobilizing transposase RayT